MSMEKNGAISNQTPSGGCCQGKSSCNSHPDAVARQKMAADAQKQKMLFPTSDKEADGIEQDLTKAAIDAVQKQSKG